MKTCMVLSINFIGVWLLFSERSVTLVFLKFSMKIGMWSNQIWPNSFQVVCDLRNNTQNHEYTLHCMHWKFAIFELDLDLHLLWSKNRQLHISTIGGCVFLCHSFRFRFHLIDSSSNVCALEPHKAIKRMDAHTATTLYDRDLLPFYDWNC